MKHRLLLVKFIAYALFSSQLTEAAPKLGEENSAEICAIDASTIGASYQLIESSLAKGGAKRSMRHIQIMRRGDEVAHVYPEEKVTEIWNLVKDGRTKVTRYFDEYQRGIEYQPGELNNGKGDSNWLGKYQLIEKSFMASLSEGGRSGKGCDEVVTFVRQTPEVSIKLQWLPSLQLVKQFEMTRQHVTTMWKLENIIQDGKQIAKVYDARSAYQTTDYADIGDNENDPFLRKLITLGFVSHGASGFYDQHGRQLEGAHQH